MDAILSEITGLKQELDAMTEELESDIRKTKEIDSQILSICDSVRKLKGEEQCFRATCIVHENQLHTLSVLSGKLNDYVSVVKSNIQEVKDVIDSTTSDMRREREEFMSSCQDFQDHVESHILLERQNLLLKKIAVGDDIDALKQNIIINQASRDEKKAYLGKLISENIGLHSLLQANITENKKSVEEIQAEEKALGVVGATSEQISWEMQENEEGKGQLKDMVIGLQNQLFHLLGVCTLLIQCLNAIYCTCMGCCMGVHSVGIMVVL